MTKNTVAVVNTAPATVLDDVAKLAGLAGMGRDLPWRSHYSERQHLVALPISGPQHDPVAAGARYGPFARTGFGISRASRIRRSSRMRSRVKISTTTCRYSGNTTSRFCTTFGTGI